MCCVGYCFGVPLICLFTLNSSYRRLKKTGTTYWDEKKFIITHSNIKFIKGIFAFLIICFYLYLITFGSYNDYYQKVKHNSVQPYVEEIQEINKNLPKMIDDETELFNVALIDKTIEYKYHLVHFNADNIDKEKLYNIMYEPLKKQTCDNLYSNNSLSSDYNVSYIYYDKNNNPIANISINAADCKTDVNNKA